MNQDKVYLDRIEANLAKATNLLNQQLKRVENISRSGLVSQPSKDLLENMGRSVELIHWQRALLLWRTRDPSIKIKKLQPSPSVSAPDRVLELICAELKTRLPVQGELDSDDINDAIKSAAQRFMATG